MTVGSLNSILNVCHAQYNLLLKQIILLVKTFSQKAFNSIAATSNSYMCH